MLEDTSMVCRPSQGVSTSGTWEYREIFWDGDLEEGIVDIWRQLLADIPHATVYQYPEWTALACRHGAIRPWLILLLTYDGQPAGLVPFYRRTPLAAEVLSPLALDHAPILFIPAMETEAWSALACWLHDKSLIRMVWLGRHGERRAVTFAQQMAVLGARHEPVDSRMVIPIPASWEAYLGGLGAGTRSGIRRMERQFLAETPGTAFEVFTDPAACGGILEEFISLHRRRWRNQPNSSIFDDPRMVQFYREAVLWAVRQGMAAMFCLRHNDVLLAAHTAFFAPGDDTMYSHIIARDPTVHPKCHSPGNLLNALTVRWAMQREFRFLDLGYGNEVQKAQIGAREHLSYELALARTTREAMLLRQIRWRALHLQRLPLRWRSFWRRLFEGGGVTGSDRSDVGRVGPV